MTRVTDEQIAEWRQELDDNCGDVGGGASLSDLAEALLDALAAEHSRADELRKERNEAWIRLRKIGEQSHAILRIVDGREE